MFLFLTFTFNCKNVLYFHFISSIQIFVQETMETMEIQIMNKKLIIENSNYEKSDNFFFYILLVFFCVIVMYTSEN